MEVGDAVIEKSRVNLSLSESHTLITLNVVFLILLLATPHHHSISRLQSSVIRLQELKNRRYTTTSGVFAAHQYLSLQTACAAEKSSPESAGIRDTSHRSATFATMANDEYDVGQKQIS